ncbi:MAG: hypothetical protein D6688_10350 [Alphaproteobacteria bacterium]|nr:MAG: hypothetical protein D6688_10350 [Alphaproteobacteria bacterium]
MRGFYRSFGGAMCFPAVLLLLAGAAAPDTLDRFWLLWEKRAEQGDCPSGRDCSVRRNFSVRPFQEADRDAALQLFTLLERKAISAGQQPDSPDAPRFCKGGAQALDFDPELLRLSNKLEALRGIRAVHFDLSRLRAPDGYAGEFGPSLQAEFERRFRAAGLQVVSEEKIQKEPGVPILNVYFSPTNLETGCHYSVFAALSQTVLLTRDIRTKLRAGTWARSEGPSDEFPEATEFDAILRIADAFLRDWVKANAH